MAASRQRYDGWGVDDVGNAAGGGTYHEYDSWDDSCAVDASAYTAITAQLRADDFAITAADSGLDDGVKLDTKDINGASGAGAGQGASEHATADSGGAASGSSDGAGRKWTEEFVDYLCRDTSTAANIVQRSSLLCGLYLDFAREASQLARTVVRELALPPSARTLAPASLAGVAGGRKFLKNGILLKVANDDSHLYGSNEAALKTASHEIKVGGSPGCAWLRRVLQCGCLITPGVCGHARRG